MTEMIKKYFGFDQTGATYKNEIIGGVTTFLTMAYIFIVNPLILQAAGMPLGPSMVATVLTAFFGTLIMGIYARRPFAIAPYMGENAFIAYTVVQVLGYSWQTALGAIFIGGVIFVIISLAGLRKWLASAIPDSLKIGFAVGIGLFLTFIGMNDAGIVVLGTAAAPVHVGDFTSGSVILGMICFLLVAILLYYRVPAALMIGILIVSVLAMIFNITDVPDAIISTPPSLGPIFLQLDIAGALTWGFLSVILTIFIIDFVDTTGTLLGISLKADLLDENGELPEIEKPMLCDSLSTVVASLLGTSTPGVYLESAAGIEAGARTGFASVITAFLFLLTLFFAPLLTAVPPCAYGPALMIVGLLMLSPIRKLKFDDLSEIVPAFVVIVLMSFTYNLGIGLTGGLVTYPLMKVFAGKYREVRGGMWVLFALSALFYIFYPY